MTESGPAAALRRLMAQPGILQAPGCYDAHSARLVERAGHRAVYMSGFGTAASLLGAPDVGLVSSRDTADHAARIAAAVDIPVIADADTGYGNVANVRHTVRTLSRAGVAAVQIEDQEWPKRCGHTAGKRVVSRDTAVARVRAAVDAARECGTLIVARTDALAVHGIDDAIDRCRAFEDAGADVVFCEAPRSLEELRRVAESVSAPAMVNVLEGGATPILSAREYADLGFAVAIYPLTLLTVATQAVRDHLAGGDEVRPYDGPLTFDELREILGFPAYDELVRRYEQG